MKTEKELILHEYDFYSQAHYDMIAQGVKHLGWINDPRVETEVKNLMDSGHKFTEVFANRSGSSCLYVDKVNKIAYSVDRGD